MCCFPSQIHSMLFLMFIFFITDTRCKSCVFVWRSRWLLSEIRLGFFHLELFVWQCSPLHSDFTHSWRLVLCTEVALWVGDSDSWLLGVSAGHLAFVLSHVSLLSSVADLHELHPRRLHVLSDCLHPVGSPRNRSERG